MLEKVTRTGKRGLGRNEMTEIAKDFATAISVFLFFYLCAAFINAALDFTQWGAGVRFVVIFLTAVAAGPSIALRRMTLI